MRTSEILREDEKAARLKFNLKHFPLEYNRETRQDEGNN